MKEFKRILATIIATVLAVSGMAIYAPAMVYAAGTTYTATYYFEGNARGLTDNGSLSGDTDFVMTDGDSISLNLTKNNNGVSANCYVRYMYEGQELELSRITGVNPSQTVTKSYSELSSMFTAKNITIPENLGVSYGEVEIVNTYNPRITIKFSNKDPLASEIAVPETTYTKLTTDAAFNLDATRTGDGTLTYESDNTSVATVNADGNVTIVGAGTSNITISMAATDTYAAAESKIVKITVDKTSSEITVPATTYTKLTTDETFNLGVTRTGDGKLTYESDNTSVATVNADGNVTIVGAGTVNITISMAATDTYAAAESKKISITVSAVESTKEAESSSTSASASDSTSKTSDTPATGDDTHVWIFLMLALVSLLGLVGIRCRRYGTKS